MILLGEKYLKDHPMNQAMKLDLIKMYADSYNLLTHDKECHRILTLCPVTSTCKCMYMFVIH